MFAVGRWLPKAHYLRRPSILGWEMMDDGWVVPSVFVLEYFREHYFNYLVLVELEQLVNQTSIIEL